MVLFREGWTSCRYENLKRRKDEESKDIVKFGLSVMEPVLKMQPRPNREAEGGQPRGPVEGELTRLVPLG